MDIPHGGYVLVCDGKKALFFRNQGDREYPNLQTLNVEAQKNPPTHEQGADRPGRMNDPTGHRSAVDDTDWHQQAEDEFARELAANLLARANQHELGELILVAPPHMLGILRKRLDAQVTRHVIAEVDKDLTKHDVRDIEDILKAS